MNRHNSTLTLSPVGIIRTPHQVPEQTPIQPCFAQGIRGEIHLNPELAEGLQGIEGFSHLYLIYHLHRAQPGALVVHPYLTDEPKGVFACRYPERPNSIGLSVVRLLGVDGCRLFIEDVDMLDGTPLLDIKPYFPKADCPDHAEGGWTDALNPVEAQRRGKRMTASV